jgi:hypothetical protein
VHNLFEIEAPPIKKNCRNRLWDLEMIGVSVVPDTVSILYIDNSHDPVVLSLRVLIDASLHPDIVVSIWLFSTAVYRSILGSSAYLSE